MKRVISALFLSVAACDGAASSTPDAATPDAATADAPAATDVTDALDVAPDDVSDAIETREAGGRCSFNRDCVAAERCECDEATGCRCAPGARGVGRPGADEMHLPDNAAYSDAIPVFINSHC